MKKIKLLVLAFLATVMALFGFAGCGVKGVYRVDSYEVAGFSKEAENSTSYIELKSDNEAYVSINVAGVFTLEGNGSWTELEEENKYELEIEGVKYNVTVADDEMIVDFLVAKIVLEKE